MYQQFRLWPLTCDAAYSAQQPTDIKDAGFAREPQSSALRLAESAPTPIRCCGAIGHLGNLTWCSVIREVRPHLPILLILQGGDSGSRRSRLIDAESVLRGSIPGELTSSKRTKLLFRAAY